MLKRKITFEDYNDPPVTHTQDFYFNLTEADLVELEVEFKGGMVATLEKIVAEEDHKELVAHFKKLVLIAYGERVGDDGLRFKKSDELREAFSQHPAYSVLFMELASDANLAAEFVNGIMPRKLAELVAAKALQDQMPEKSTAELAAELNRPSAEA